ncbi:MULTISPECIES: sulfurtransferase TusA family protein [Sphingomonas]|uniref:sulfurtransferase TusA family protein n=1 Tax=Sphingomonas TaxID=13687 RepID=UPI0010431224|nr:MULTISPECIES: sulfurtransferase TusA family protein [Sphingomonas]TCQ05070.1 tRNA 2-thiouridine synthesizing protein A [Sphingomonas sp. PP-CC-3A-396]
MSGVVCIDARGMRCPWPALRLARALRDGARRVEVLADDPQAPTELAAVADAAGATVKIILDEFYRTFVVTCR